MSLAILFHFLCAQHVSDINNIHRQELATVLLNYNIGRFVLGSLCVGDLVRLGLSGVRVAGWSFSLQRICPGLKSAFYIETISLLTYLRSSSFTLTPGESVMLYSEALFTYKAKRYVSAMSWRRGSERTAPPILNLCNIRKWIIYLLAPSPLSPVLALQETDISIQRASQQPNTLFCIQ